MVALGMRRRVEQQDSFQQASSRLDLLTRRGRPTAYATALLAFV
jgi:hypothetical protein